MSATEETEIIEEAGPASSSEPSTPVKVSRRVFVGNLSYRVTWQMLKDHMRSAGVVAYATIFLNERRLSRGCGVVEYETAEEALNAQKTLHDTMLGDRRIFVREDREDKEIKGPSAGSHSKPAPAHPRDRYTPRQTTLVLVDGLPPSTNWRDLKDLFKKHAPVTRADVSASGQGSLTFSSPADAQTVIDKLNNSTFRGQTLTVRLG